MAPANSLRTVFRGLTATCRQRHPPLITASRQAHGICSSPERLLRAIALAVSSPSPLQLSLLPFTRAHRGGCVDRLLVLLTRLTKEKGNQCGHCVKLARSNWTSAASSLFPCSGFHWRQGLGLYRHSRPQFHLRLELLSPPSTQPPSCSTPVRVSRF